jgi:hypothetical protein
MSDPDPKAEFIEQVGNNRPEIVKTFIYRDKMANRLRRLKWYQFSKRCGVKREIARLSAKLDLLIEEEILKY